MTISLTNLTPAPFTINLYHDSYCANGGPCNCKEKTFAHHVYPKVKRGEPIPTGEKTIEYDTKLEPVSIDIPPKSTVHGLHDAILKIPQVKTALSPKFKVLRAVNNPGKAVTAPVPSSIPADAPSSDDETPLDGEEEPRSRNRKPSSKARR